jgi:hypothetical protein
MKRTHSLPMRILPFLFFLMVSTKAFSQPPIIVHADPALGAFDITDLGNVPTDANLLVNGGTYLLKLTFQNLSFVNGIPPGTAYLRIGLGLNMILDPTFVIANAPYNQYFTWSYDVSQSQPQIIGILHTELPAFFDGTAEFRVKANAVGTSTVSGNFLVANPPGNPYRLIDDNPSNNSASIDYTVIVGSPTPVTLKKFNVMKKDCDIMTNWQVENEINFDHYELQVSNDGVNFATINNIPAANKSIYNSAIAISNLAASLQGNKLYVRLKMVDRDASFKYSDIVPVSGNCSGSSEFVIYGYPNPVSGDNITIAGKGTTVFNGRYSISLMDMKGRIYAVKEMELNNVQSFRFNFETMLTNGMYMIRIQQKNGSQNGVIQFEKL